MKKLLFIFTIIFTLIFSNITFAAYTDNLEDKDYLSAQLIVSEKKINSDSTIKYVDGKIEEMSDNLKKLSKLYSKIPLVREKIEGSSNKTYIMLGHILDYIEAKVGLIIYDLTGNTDVDNGISEEGIVAYVDDNCIEEICTKTYIDNIVGQQLLGGKKADISIVSLTEEKWGIFKENLSGSPILSFSKEFANFLIKTYPGVENYLQKMGDNFYLVLGAWIPGAENLCNDEIDNNGDGNIDADDETCNIITILYDSRCNEGWVCDIETLTTNLKQQTFDLGFIVNTIDYTTEEGKTIYKEVGGNLPTILSVDLPIVLKDQLDNANYLEELDSKQYTYMITFFPSTWNPIGEICDNKIDDNNNGQIDCEDTSCSSEAQCREEKKGQLDVFIMSYCPFGEIAMKQIPLLQESLDNNIELGIHYIATKIGDGYRAEDFQSLHGVPESEENIRQLCVQEYYGTQKLIDYMQVRYENANNYGQVNDDSSIALESIEADVEEINTCVTGGEGGKLLAEDIKIGQELKIGASPTWMANNRYEFSGIDANKIKVEFCKYNEEIEGCESRDVIDTGSSGGGASCGQ